MSVKNKLFYFNTIRENRDYGIDLLRIVAMFLIVTGHVLLHGGILDELEPGSLKYWVAWGINTIAYMAVDIYAMISGYVGYKAKYRYSNIAELWIRVTTYTVSLTILFHFITNEIGKRKLLEALFPVMTKQYWYFTAYFGLFLLMPFLNMAVNSLPKKHLKAVLCISVSAMVIPLLFGKDIYGVSGGYCTLWLIVLYVIGAYIGKYRPFQNTKKLKLFLVYVLLTVISFVTKIILYYVKPYLDYVSIPEDAFIKYTSVSFIGASVCLISLFSGLNLKIYTKKIVAFAAPLTFGVYLIHEFSLIRTRFISDSFAAFASASAPVMVLKIFAAAAGIFAVCILIDYFRQVIFNLLNIKGRLLKFEEKHIKVFSQESKTE